MDLAALRTQQQQLAASVERADRLDRDPPALIGGADVGFEQEGDHPGCDGAADLA